ncbi:MAG TPA: DUF2892 domain-containing protein [Thiohalobacter sp.]|nr:DUF2892 domain-containing protein [Thiohalobacter sp.]
MKINEGSLDRGIRIIVGVALIGLTVAGTIGVWGWIGVLPLVTGVVGWCPGYALLGINSCGTRN